MKTLPNGLRVFNSTPHTIRFWSPEWAEPVEVEPDAIVSAEVEEKSIDLVGVPGIAFVTPKFTATTEGRDVITQAYQEGAGLIVGSIIAAQAYPGLVVGMTPCEGYERVHPSEKRMRPDKFTVFAA